MSTNASSTTEHYGLSQWAATDGVCRSDFNSDNAAIDAALRQLAVGGPKIAIGSYVGTGTFGPSNHSSLTFDFPPKVVYIMPKVSSNYSFTWIYPSPNARMFHSSSTGDRNLPVTLNGNTISWYSGQYTSAEFQLNDIVTYYYLVIG